MNTLFKGLIIVTSICIGLSCSKSESSVKPVATKCKNSTILDELLSGKQMYILATVWRGSVLLNLKDKKGKARAFVGTASTPSVYEWDIQISSVNDLQVKLEAGDIIAIRGNFVAGLYFPDSFLFNDNNCKISVESYDGQVTFNPTSSYQDITNSKDLPSILEKYLF